MRDVSLTYYKDVVSRNINWLWYKATGRIANSAEGLILVFDLDDAAKFDALPEEYVDPATGEVKKHIKVYYPEKYRGRVGNYYNDYVAKEQISMFESLEDTGTAGSLRHCNNTGRIHEAYR